MSHLEFSYRSIDSLDGVFDDGDAHGGSIAFIDPGLSPTSEGLLSLCEHVGLPERQADLVVLRGEGPAFVELVNVNSRLQRLMPKEQRVAILASGAEGREGPLGPRLSWPRWSPQPRSKTGEVLYTPPDLTQLRRVEMLGLLKTYGAILDQPGRHYILPGGGHSDSYVRLRSAFSRRLPATRLAEWILPMTSGDSTVFFAHRGLGTVMACLELLALKYRDWRFKTVEVPPYRLFRTQDPHVAPELKTEPADLVVLGVDRNDSRSKALDNRRLAEVPRARLVDISETPSDRDSFVQLPIAQFRPDEDNECDICRGNPDLKVESINADSEERRAFFKPHPVRVGFRYAKPYREFWQIVERQGALKLHAYDSYPQREYRPGRTGPGHVPLMRRHRAIDLNVRLLLGDPAFRAKCVSSLRDACGGAVPDLVVIPRHGDTAPLEALVVEALEISRSRVSYVDRHDPEYSELDRLTEGSFVLYLDDMAVTGGTLVALDSAMRHQLGDQAFRRLKRIAFVPIFSVWDQEPEGRLRNRFKTDQLREGVRYAYCVPLPSPEVDCPWCRESALWNGNSHLLPGTLDDFVTERLEQLSLNAGFSDISILASSKEEIVGSAVGDVSPEVAFAAWTTATLDALKDSGLAFDDRNGYIDLAWALENWDNGAQFSGILRSCPEGFIRSQHQEEKFLKALEDLQWPPPEKLIELGWAAFENKLTSGSALAVLDAIGQRRDEDPAFAAVEKLLSARLGQ